MDVLQWLLEPENPSVRYRTLVELLDLGETPEAREAKRSIPESLPVRKLLDAMHPDGYWLQKDARTGLYRGDGVEYGSFGTTHFCLSYCDDMTRDAFPVIWRTNIWEILYALGRMGYGRDERLKDAWHVLQSRRLPDGRFVLDRTPAQSPWKIGKVGEPNKWLTLYGLLAEKHAGPV